MITKLPGSGKNPVILGPGEQPAEHEQLCPGGQEAKGIWLGPAMGWPQGQQ